MVLSSWSKKYFRYIKLSWNYSTSDDGDVEKSETMSRTLRRTLSHEIMMKNKWYNWFYIPSPSPSVKVSKGKPKKIVPPRMRCLHLGFTTKTINDYNDGTKTWVLDFCTGSYPTPNLDEIWTILNLNLVLRYTKYRKYKSLRLFLRYSLKMSEIIVITEWENISLGVF